MKETGIIRKVDGLGRIVLPIELRKHMEIETGSDIEIFVDEDKVVLKKHAPACLFCGSNAALIEFAGKNVCKACRKKLSKLD